MAGFTASKILSKLGLNIEEMYFELDGTFPNHEADPLKEKNVVEIKERVVEEKFDLGLAFDGDADRVFFIDETTGFVAGDVTVAGDVDEAPDTEVLSFTAAGTVKTTRKRFDAGTLTAFSSTLPGTVTVLARAVGAGGDRLNINTTVITGWPARFDRGRGRWRNLAQGTQQVEQTRFYVDYTTVWDPRDGDTIVNDKNLEEFLVIGSPDLHGARLIAHHWEIEVRRREQSSTT